LTVEAAKCIIVSIIKIFKGGLTVLCSYASVTEEKLNALQKMEKEVGQTLLAFSCQQFQPAQLTDEQLEKIQDLEKELGMVLVAV
jgi:glutathione peroxidase-family protein